MGGVGLVLLALLGTFTLFTAYLCFGWRTTCRARTTKGHPCKNDARGLLGGCHLRDHKRQKRRAVWGALSSGRYPGDRLAGLAPVRAEPVMALRRQLRTSRIPVDALRDDSQVRLARWSLVFTAVGAVATVVGLAVTLLR